MVQFSNGLVTVMQRVFTMQKEKKKATVYNIYIISEQITESVMRKVGHADYVWKE